MLLPTRPGETNTVGEVALTVRTLNLYQTTPGDYTLYVAYVSDY